MKMKKVYKRKKYAIKDMKNYQRKYGIIVSISKFTDGRFHIKEAK